MLKKIIVALGVIFLLMVLVLGWDKTWSYAQGTKQVLNQEADDRTPMKLEGARITALIEKENSNIIAYEDRICDLEARRGSTARAIEEANKKVNQEKKLLDRIKQMLDEKRDEYTIGRHTYSYPEINADALERLESVKRMQEDISFKESLLADLDRAIEQGRGSLGEAGKRVLELQNGMARLEARNANADVRLQVTKLTNAIAGAPLTADSELEKAIRNYERRVGQKERRAVSRLTASNGQFRIDYSAALVTQDASAEIGRLLHEESGGPGVSEAPASRPSAAESLEQNHS